MIVSKKKIIKEYENIKNNETGFIRQVLFMKVGNEMSKEQLESIKESLEIQVKKELFSFHSEQDWISKAQSRYSTCGVRKDMYITVDANGHILHMGQCFAEATKANAYPVRVYELKTNWSKS